MLPNDESEYPQLQVDLLERRLRAVEDRLARIERMMPEQKVVLLREIPKEQAEKEIKDLFLNGGVLYYSDIAERLGLDLKLVVDICNELEARGEIGTVDNPVRSG